MEKQYILSKIKKYLFFISVFFLISSTIHLVYNYTYHDSKDVAEKWGTISEWIIWTFPHLNPLKTSHDYNDYINHILYRSLLSYNTSSEKIEWDITNCDISDLSSIECFLNDNITWSNWEDITYDDIVATYEVLKETSVNPSIKSILQGIEIKQKDTSIVFKTDKQDINTLNIFFQPILPESLIKNLWEKDLLWNFSPINWVYSWKYAITKVSQDETLWITKIFLEKNKFFISSPAYIDKIVFKIFKDTSHFLKHKNSVNVFYDKKNLIWESIPKLESHKHHLPQYISLFVNTEKVPYSQLRNYVLMSIDNEKLVEELWKENFKKIDSPFINDIILENVKQTKFLKDMLNSLWYYNKETLLEKFTPTTDRKNTFSSEVTINNEVSNLDDKTETYTWSYTTLNYIKKSSLIFSPDWVDNYNFITKDDLVIKWNISKDIDAIYINDYELKWFTAWDKDFFYRLKLSYNTLKEGKNEYNIYFEKDWKKTLAEKVVFFYSSSKEKLATYETQLIEDLNKKEIADKITADRAKEEKLTTNTKPKEDLEYKELLIKISDLENDFYYNDKLEVFSLNLKYVLTWNDTEKTASFVKNSIEKRWIKINIQAITINELTNSLRNDIKDYDILIAWINTGYHNFNLFPYFHSSQAKSGYNFSNLKKLSLDQILEELKSHNLSKEKILELERKLITIIKEESIIKTLYTPLYSNLVDKTIHWYQLEDNIPSEIHRFDPLINSYVLKKRIINKDWKGTLNFFKYLINLLF